MHTSTVSVTLIENKHSEQVIIKDNDLKVTYTQGSGPGGQHRNRTYSCVVMTHVTSGVQVRIDGRNQHQNYREAKKEIQKRLDLEYNKDVSNKISKIKKDQIGINNRANKKRTYNVKTGIVKDHNSGKSTSLKNVYKGKIELLH